MISSERVREIFGDCLFRDEEVVDGKPIGEVRVADGVMNTMGFHAGRIDGYKSEVRSMLDDLPEQFHEKSGGGWSFLNACSTKDGTLWTGEHRVVDQLFCLGLALGMVAYNAPRAMWKMLPGGMPFIVVKEKE